MNPAAGRGRAARAAVAVAGRLTAARFDVDLIDAPTTAAARDRLRAAVMRRPSGVLALGGDGTVHLAVGAVAGTGIPLGIVPLGTGNDVARCLGVPRDPTTAAAAVVADLRSGAGRRFDAATAGERWFAGVLAAGFDARVNERANALRWPRGPRRYDLATIAELASFRPLPYDLELDGERTSLQGMLVAIGNIESYGGGLRIAHGARPDDGLLDVLIVHRVSRAVLLQIFPSVRGGGHLRHPGVEIRRARVVKVSAPGVIAYADGERVAALPLTVTVHPGALRMVGAGRA